MIISQNTTWTAGQTITLTEAVQVASGVRLTIEPGAIVNGQGHELQTFGELYAGGNPDSLAWLNQVQLTLGGAQGSAGYIKLDSVALNGGSFLPSGLHQNHVGHFDATNSVFLQDPGRKYMHIMYLDKTSTFAGNMFLGDFEISVWVDNADVRFINNLISAERGVSIVGAYNGYSAYFAGNTFAQPHGVYAIKLHPGAKDVDAQGNFFQPRGNTNTAGRIYDRADDLNLSGFVNVSGELSVGSLGTPNLNDAAHFRDEVFAGGDGWDIQLAGWGNDTMTGGLGSDHLWGGRGADWIDGGAEFDNLHGNTGNDTLYGADGDDWVVGGQGNDALSGDFGADFVHGNMGSDALYGGYGKDTLLGGQDNDVLFGEAGDDWLSGDRGNDTMSGGGGTDIFRVHVGMGDDVVMDFAHGQDGLQLDPGTKGYFVQNGPDVTLIVEGGGSITLLGVHPTPAAPIWIVT